MEEGLNTSVLEEGTGKLIQTLVDSGVNPEHLEEVVISITLSGGVTVTKVVGKE